METLRAFLSGCMASLSFSSPKGSAEALPEVFSPLQNLPAPSHTANICRIRRLPTLTERLCEMVGTALRGQAPRLDPVLDSKAHEATRHLCAGSVLSDQVHL